MKGQKILFSHKSDEWETPKNILDFIKENYVVGYDLAANEHNKITSGFTDNLTPEKLEALKNIISFAKDKTPVRVAYCNPPYSKCMEFVKMIYESECPCIMLLPARTDTRWFHNYIYNKENIRIEFLKGRLKFSESKNSAPFPSMLVYFKC